MKRAHMLEIAAMAERLETEIGDLRDQLYADIPGNQAPSGTDAAVDRLAMLTAGLAQLVRYLAAGEAA